MNETPLIYAFLKPKKSFNPSANPSFSLILRRKVAEGFGFQTLQPTLQPWFVREHEKSNFTRTGSGKTEAGPSVTTRRAVAPKPGLVGLEPEGFGKKRTLKATCQAEPS